LEKFKYLYAIRSILCLYFRHADATKLKSTLEGVEKGHAIAMEGLQQQLQKSLALNTLLKEQLKDQECHNLKKDKEIEDVRKAATEFEQQRDGFNELLYHFQRTLLGINGSPYCVICNNALCRM
jgi:hypothetical protein